MPFSQSENRESVDGLVAGLHTKAVSEYSHAGGAGGKYGNIGFWTCKERTSSMN